MKTLPFYDCNVVPVDLVAAAARLPKGHVGAAAGGRPMLIPLAVVPESLTAALSCRLIRRLLSLGHNGTKLGGALACSQAAYPQIFLLNRGLTVIHNALVHHRCTVRALSCLSAGDVLGLTPLGPLPSDTLGCSVAVPRCQVSAGGDAVAFPPPHDSFGERYPVLWFSFTLTGARPRSESLRRLQRGLQSAPLLWAPATCTVGHLVGVFVVIAPHVLPIHIP